MFALVWRGVMAGAAVAAAQLAFSLPAAQYSGLDTRQRLPLVILAVCFGVPISGLVVGVLAARLLRLRRPVLVAVAGLALSIGLAMVTLWLGVPHLPVTTDPGVWCFGAACAVPGYAAAAMILVPPWSASGPLRCAGAFAAAAAVVVAGSLAWLEVAYTLRAQALRDTGVLLMVADIPGYQIRDVKVRHGPAPEVKLSYVRSPGSGDVITMDVYRDAGRPRDCAEALASLGRRGISYSCRDMGDRWVLDHVDDRWHVVIATRVDNVVVMNGAVPEMVRATLRTASARELAEEQPGVS